MGGNSPSTPRTSWNSRHTRFLYRWCASFHQQHWRLSSSYRWASHWKNTFGYCMLEKGEWNDVAHGLVSRGLCEVVELDSLHHVKGQPLLNGMFSVGKQEFFEGSQGRTEICRLIMNLKPANLISRPLEGDTGTLPAITQMGGCYLAEGEVLTTSSEDLRCFFYLFRVPAAWQRFMGFGKDAPEELVPPEKKGKRHVLTSKVLPMGYLNSVGIAQHIHREVVRRCLEQIPNQVGGHQEIRRDKVFSSHGNQFRIYLDNFDQLQKLDADMARLVEGKPSEMVLALREAYEMKGLPRHPKKSTEQAIAAEAQGAWVDGAQGTISAKPSKIAKYIRLGLELLKVGKATTGRRRRLCIYLHVQETVTGNFEPSLEKHHWSGGEAQTL